MKHYLEQEQETLLKEDPEIFKFIQNRSLDGLWYWDLENPDEEINVKQFVERTINLEKVQISRQNVKVNLNCADHIKVKTIPTFFDSIFHNLIYNALKYGITENNSIIDINVGYQDEKLQIKVRDYGREFDLPNNAELLFKLGTRLDREKMGQGLGLFITRHHAKIIGTTIEVNSAPGKGASFKIIWNE